MSDERLGAAIANALNGVRSAADELLGGIQKIRDSIDEIEAEIGDLESAPVSELEAFARVDEFILNMQHSGAKGEANISAFICPPRDWRMPRADFEELAWRYLAQAVADGMRSEVADFYRSNEGVSMSDRSDQLSRLRQAKLEAELAEESVVRQAESIGIAIARRGNADPRAVLAHRDCLP